VQSNVEAITKILVLDINANSLKKTLLKEWFQLIS
jgi:hypothetical protein